MHLAFSTRVRTELRCVHVLFLARSRPPSAIGADPDLDPDPRLQVDQVALHASQVLVGFC